MGQLNGYDETGVGSAVSMAENRRDVFTGAGRLFVNGDEIGSATSLRLAIKSEEAVNMYKVERDLSVTGTISLGLYPAALWRLRAFMNGFSRLPRGKMFSRSRRIKGN